MNLSHFHDTVRVCVCVWVLIVTLPVVYLQMTEETKKKTGPLRDCSLTNILL